MHRIAIVPTVRALPDISIRQLEYLVAVADHDTWSLAAEAVGVSPSALSQGLAELERRVGVELFEPAGRRRIMRLSASPVLDHARQVVALTLDLTTWSDRLRSARSGRVAVGMVDVAAVEHYPDVLRRFRAERPEVDLTLSVAPSAELLAGLRAGALDLIVCVDPPEWPVGLEVVPLLDEPIVVCAPAGTVIGEASAWGPWVVFPHDSHTRFQIMRRLAELGAPLAVAAESHQASVLRQMVELGLGWTVLPASDANAALVTGPILFHRRLVLVRRAGSVHDPAADALASILSEGRPSGF